MTLTPNQERALLVDCSICFTDPGEGCVSEDGTEVVPIHKERIEEADRLLERGLKAYA